MSASTTPPPPAKPRTVDVFGVDVHAMTEPQTVDYVLDSIDAGRGGVLLTPNLDYLRRCVDSPEFRELVAAADVVVADGNPLVWASRIAGDALPGLVAGSNLISSLSDGAARRGRSVFLLGGNAGAAAGAADVLVRRAPTLRVAGTWCPPFGFEDDAAEIRRMSDALLAASPDVVFVGIGSPKTERLIRLFRPLLPGTWWISVGISFSYLTGDVRRAPVWMRRCGLEWLHRLFGEPRRLARRYLVEGIPFALRLTAWAVRRRLGRTG